MGASLGEQLRRADLAFAQGRMAEPPGDNALDYYLTVLAVQPTHSLARDRLAIVVEGLFSQAEEALLTSSFERADAALSSVRRADPTSSRLGFQDAQLQRARAAASPVAGGAGGAGRSVSLRAAPPGATPDVIVAPALGGPEPAELESLLTIAAARVRRGQLIEPVGDSAYEYVERAARLSPTDPRVVAARAQIAAQLVAAARVGLDVADVDTAEDLLDEARRLGADPERLTVLDLEVASARAAQVRQREAALLAALRQRLLSEALFDPPDDSALYYLETLQNQGSVVAGLAAARAELVTTLVGNVRAALERHDWVAAQAGLDGLARARGDPATVQRLEQQLETARLQEQYLAVAAPASELRLLDFAQPVYPPDAVQRGVQGWVELEFVIDREGRLRDIATVAAEPAGRFEQAALAAVRQYRYAPFQLQGHTYERRARLRIRFTLE
jgi:protein TonB